VLFFEDVFEEVAGVGGVEVEGPNFKHRLDVIGGEVCLLGYLHIFFKLVVRVLLGYHAVGEQFFDFIEFFVVGLVACGGRMLGVLFFLLVLVFVGLGAVSG
jgi:hypothetical protein